MSWQTAFLIAVFLMMAISLLPLMGILFWQWLDEPLSFSEAFHALNARVLVTIAVIVATGFIACVVKLCGDWMDIKP